MPSSPENWGERQVAKRKLTPEQVRAVRLSMEDGVQLGKRYGVNRRLIGEVRSGRKYGPLKRDERAAHVRRSRHELGGFVLEDNLLAVGPQVTVQNLLRGQDAPEALDAAHECPHGRLVGDRTPPCGCFATETNPTPRRNDADHVHAHRLERFAAQAARRRADHGRPAHDRPLVASGADQR